MTFQDAQIAALKADKAELLMALEKLMSAYQSLCVTTGHGHYLKCEATVYCAVQKVIHQHTATKGANK